MTESNRGGYRHGAGRKGLWKSGETKAIKLPIALIPRILEIAKILDEGGEILELKKDFGTGGTPRELTRWNLYEKVGDSEWKLKDSLLTEQEAQSRIKSLKESKRKFETYGDHGYLNIEYEIRLERISPAQAAHPRPDDAVLGTAHCGG